jgi:benzoylformate decarboxylase
VTTVRDAAFDLFRRRGMTTIFGNPGSTELPMLADYPSDFRYILGLQEAVVVGMADGYAQASGAVAHANLHTAPGLGNAMGAIFNAQANKSPLLITAGQQVRSYMTLQANLTNHRATEVPQPYVKWSFEPPRAQDVPAALARATYLASLPPAGPAFVSLPMDDWGQEVDADAAQLAISRTVTGRAGADPAAVRDLAARLTGARNPVLIAGPGIDAAGAWDQAIALAERQALPVYATPAPGGGRLGFPEGHPHFRGTLAPAIGPAGQMLAAHDLVLVVGSSVFPYYPHMAGPALAPGTALIAITNDPDEAARAPMGDAIVADVALTLDALLEALGDAPVDREPPAPLDAPPSLAAFAGPDAAGDDTGGAMDAGDVHGVLAELWPDDAIAVLESPSSTLAFRNRLRISRPGSYYFGAAGGLGFGLSAAIGIQLAQPDRPVVCVLGEGSAQYAITGFWTAKAYNVPVTFLILRNSEYAILKWFSVLEQVSGAPGLDLPALDVAATAASYGVPGVKVSGRDELHGALSAALQAGDGPRLVEVGVQPGMALV